MEQPSKSAVKERGAYYTPKVISNFIVKWGLERTHNSAEILEQSCGDGAFLNALTDSSKLMKGKNIKILAIEMDKDEAKKSRIIGNRLRSNSNITCNTVASEYFTYMRAVKSRAKRKFNFVLGNPPYIKQSNFVEGRSQAKSRMEELGLEINQQSNAWVYFVIDAVSRMSQNSHIGLVIPADLLQLGYAKKVQSYLIEHLDDILIIGFDELVFPSIQQDVVLLLGKKSKRRKKKRIGLISVKNSSSLSSDLWKEFLRSKELKNVDNIDWNLQYLHESKLSKINKIFDKKNVFSLGELSDNRIGIVTGANEFFCVDKVKLSELRIRRGRNKGVHVKKMLGAKMDVPGIEYTQKDHEHNHKNHKKTNFLNFNTEYPRKNLSDELKSYLSMGEEKEYDARTQLARRTPWFSPEHVIATRIGLYKRCDEFCKLFLKPDDVYHTDTIYRLWVIKNSNEITPQKVVFSFANSLTYLSCEMVGRNYGGGVLELTQGEIRLLKLPIYDCTEDEFAHLDEMFRNNTSIEQILDYTDDLTLNFLNKSERKLIRESWRYLKNRRMNRKKRGGGSDGSK
ncbi:N-6 DNA methylase [Euryarchaeota archaeon]|nr:N-6 DNA methylase [Euryarchaeota archaeon]